MNKNNFLLKQMKNREYRADGDRAGRRGGKRKLRAFAQPEPGVSLCFYRISSNKKNRMKQ
ncbi:MAG: hypothetical protein D3916_13210 [Candidatus Electrothrix sp. MAN1_4]|nr:hypothetical protein [Candidatus Electrothrix sp. MAN1_4]